MNYILALCENKPDSRRAAVGIPLTDGNGVRHDKCMKLAVFFTSAAQEKKAWAYAFYRCGGFPIAA
jgi:hypothetical protein